MENENIKNLKKFKAKIGSTLFNELVNEMPGVLLRLPNDAEFFDKDERDNQIRNAYHRGISRKDLAVKFKLSLHRVNKIIANKPNKKAIEPLHDSVSI